MGIGRLTRYAYPYNNVGVNQLATNEVQTGKTIDTYRLGLGGTALTKSMLSTIRIRANSRLIIDVSGDELDKLLAYRGQAADAAYIDVPFSDRTGLTEMDRMRGAFDTSIGIQKLTTEIQIGAATAPTLKGILFESARQSDGAGKSLPFAGEIAHVLRYPWDKSTGGILPVKIAGAKMVAKRLHFFHTGNLTAMEIKQDGITIHQSTAAENSYEQESWGRTPQANVYTVDFMLDGNSLKALDMHDGLPLEILPTFSAADSGVLLVEALARLGDV